MTKRNTNYFKEVHSSMDVFLALLMGFFLGWGLYLVDEHNLMTRFMMKLSLTPNVQSMILTALMGCVIAASVALVLIVLPNLFRRHVTKVDFALVTYDFLMLTLLIFSAVGMGDFARRIVLWGVLLAIGIILSVIRVIYVSDHTSEERLQMKEYMAILARKYHLPVILVGGVIVGILAGLLIYHVDLDAKLESIWPWWDSLTKYQKIGYVGGVGATLIVGLNLYTVFSGRNSKVSWIDAVLFGLTTSVLFGGIYFAFNFPCRPKMQYLMWFVAVFALLITLFMRSLFVNMNATYRQEVKKVDNYYGMLSEKSSVALIAGLGLLFAMGLFYIDYVGLKAAFKGGTNILISLLLILAFVGLAVLFVLSMIKKGLRDDRIIGLDFVLATGCVAGTLMIFDLFYDFTAVKFILWIVAYIAVIALTAIRIRLADLETVAIASKADEEVSVPVEESEKEEIASIEEDETSEINESASEADVTNDIRTISRHSFINKLKFTSDKTKGFYSELKNALMSYGVKNRVAKKNEAFRKSGLVAKISVSGKTIRLHLPLNPTDEVTYNPAKYHQFSLADRNQYKDVPFTIKIRSGLALKRALELIDAVMESRGLKKKKKFEPQNYAADLVVDGEAIFEKIGCSDRMSDTFTQDRFEEFKRDNAEACDLIRNLIPSVEKTEAEGEVNSQNVYIDTVLDKIQGDVISLDSLKEASKISLSTNKIIVKIHNSLDRKITVYCDDITEDATYAVLSTGGTVILTK